jgi:hypothetical protein
MWVLAEYGPTAGAGSFRVSQNNPPGRGESAVLPGSVQGVISLAKMATHHVWRPDGMIRDVYIEIFKVIPGYNR